MSHLKAKRLHPGIPDVKNFNEEGRLPRYHFTTIESRAVRKQGRAKVEEKHSFLLVVFSGLLLYAVGSSSTHADDFTRTGISGRAGPGRAPITKWPLRESLSLCAPSLDSLMSSGSFCTTSAFSVFLLADRVSQREEIS